MTYIQLKHSTIGPFGPSLNDKLASFTETYSGILGLSNHPQDWPGVSDAVLKSVFLYSAAAAAAGHSGSLESLTAAPPPFPHPLHSAHHIDSIYI